MFKYKGLSQGKRLSLFFLISGITLGIVLIASSDIQTWEALRLIDLRDVVFLFILLGLMLLFDALCIMVLAVSLGHRLALIYAFRMILVGRFFGAITPLQSGMMPAEMYMLFKQGIPLGQAISIDVIRRISTMGVLAIGGIIVLVINKDFATNKIILYAYYYVVFFYVFLTLLFLFVYLFPQKTLWVVDRIMAYLHRRSIVKNYEVDEYVHRVANDYFQALNIYLTKGLWGFLLSLVFVMLTMMSQFVMAPIIIHSMGFKTSFMEAFQAQVILIPMLYFAPTPGGSGVAEGGFALLFAGFIPKHLLGMTVVLWRVFTTYICVALGGILTIGSLSLDKVLSFGSRK
ncbi:MAG: flippase-like domain-containing protein [Deltaproteobacteria bacterium]|nr:flippase-like domain-containing protein [Deltaproteobacteria bacterium]